MKYVSTRDALKTFEFKDVFIKGLADDGGLFIPQTLADDGDPLDIIIYSRFSFTTGCVSECKIIGGLDMTENGNKDYKIIGVPTFIESVNHIKDLKDDWLEVTRDFFKNYKNVEKKKVTVGKWFTANKAKQIVKKSFINK